MCLCSAGRVCSPVSSAYKPTLLPFRHRPALASSLLSAFTAVRDAGDSDLFLLTCVLALTKAGSQVGLSSATCVEVGALINSFPGGHAQVADLVRACVGLPVQVGGQTFKKLAKILGPLRAA